MGREGEIPHDPTKTGTDLSSAPHVLVMFIGEFKGRNKYMMPPYLPSQCNLVRDKTEMVVSGVDEDSSKGGIHSRAGIWLQ
jgi:hypothetical protein